MGTGFFTSIFFQQSIPLESISMVDTLIAHA